MDYLPYNELTKQEKKLVLEAEKAMKNSYNPYSFFYVGAAVLTGKGKIFSAANMANGSSSVNLCAERAVIATANSAGHRDIRAMAIIAKSGKNHYDDIITPCGVCRQFLFEIERITGKELQIICVDPKKKSVLKATISELLPLPHTRSH